MTWRSATRLGRPVPTPAQDVGVGAGAGDAARRASLDPLAVGFETEDAEGSRPARRTVQAVGRALDGVLDVAVASLAWWTVLYGTLLMGVPLPVAVVGWLLGTGLLAVSRVRRGWYRAPGETAVRGTAMALATAMVAAAVSSVVQRPDGDDAAFVIRSTWVADRGRLPTGDMIFSDGSWPATFGTEPHLASIETLFGAIARYTPLSVGDVVYRYFVPLATFAAVWAVWLLLRAAGARRPAAVLLVTMVFIALGGYAHATWGNVHLARMWQGKVLLVAVLVPYLYAVLVSVLGRRRSMRPGALLVLLGVGAAAVGSSSTAVFLIPLIAVAGTASAVVERRWRDAAAVVAALSLAPVVAGVVTVLSPAGARNEGGRTAEWLWNRVLADGAIATVAVVAGVVVLAGVVFPGWLGSVDPSAQRLLAGVIVLGVLFTLPPVYPVLVALMGGDAIAFRLAWVVPLPVVVGLLASLPRRRWALPVLPLTAGALAVLLVAGEPLWSGANLAQVGRPGSWKVRDQADLVAARWIVEQEPQGRYLAANWVSIMVGVLTSELRPVGTRMDFVRSLDQVPGGQVEERVLLQGIADGVESRLPANLSPALDALDALDVDVACVAWDDAFTQELFGTAGFGSTFVAGPWTCWERTDASATS